MATTEFIAAIELGSSKISAIAGKKNSDGSIEVLAQARVEAPSFMHKGVVFNIDKAAAALTSVIGKLEEQLKASVAQVYVGIGGQSLHSLKSAVSRSVGDEESTVSQSLVDALYDENRETPLADFVILDVVPQEFKVDHTLHADPVGVTGHHVTGQYLNLVARTSLKKNVEMAFSQAHIQIADDLLVTAVAEAKAILSQTEMRQGCALVDMGSDTTTVSIYKNNLLRHLCVLPIGGNNITRDLTSLQMEEEEAEKLKIQYGNAAYEEQESEPNASYLTSEGRAIPLAELNNIIGARAEEILANVWNQIRISGYENQLFAGTIFTGGGALLKNLEEAFRKLSKTDRVKTVLKPQLTLQGMSEQLVADGSWNAAIALIHTGHENCCKQEEPAEPAEVVTPEQTIHRQEQPEIQDLFKDDEDLKRQEEQERIRREEERRRQEEERIRKQKEEQQKPKTPKPKKPNYLKKIIKEFSENFFTDDQLDEEKKNNE